MSIIMMRMIILIVIIALDRLIIMIYPAVALRDPSPSSSAPHHTSRPLYALYQTLPLMSTTYMAEFLHLAIPPILRVRRNLSPKRTHKKPGETQLLDSRALQVWGLNFAGRRKSPHVVLDAQPADWYTDYRPHGYLNPASW